MFDAVGRSYRIFRESVAVLRQDREILLFPILSGIVGVLAMASMVFGGFALGLFTGILEKGASGGSAAGYVLLFVWYAVTWTIALYFNVATIACARIRLDGGDPVVADGFRAANKHFARIVTWALVSATVGLVLQMIADRFKLVGEIIQKLFGAAWSVATYFIVPVMIFEERPLGDSVRQSTALVRKTWGEALAAHVGIGLFVVLLAIPGVALPLVLGTIAGPKGAFAGAILMLAYWLALAAVSSALTGIYRTALYLYATTGQQPKAFSSELVVQAFRPR